MKAPQLETKDTLIRLVEPNVERDAALGLKWLNGELGRITMQSMGNSEEALQEILPTTLELEEERVKDFIHGENQLNWMIEHDGNVVGSVWVDLHDSDDLPSPSVHIMIGEPAMRGKGVGTSAMGMVLNYLKEQDFNDIYSRHLTSNEGADKLLKQFGFTDLGNTYTSDTLEFQNLVRK
ncbi:MAG: hypothetical protein QG593_541 [Patescibacteria group bacterium]|jgi:RimJ/RimL family protein N-acetyltransferase|nr:hypothetical protein [Patescibacteria group bacterium]MDQ5970024.1 hypothetical protein [Patescibacteria group bacterium]